MSKEILIQCDACNNYNKAKIGLFAPKIIQCSKCKASINLKDNRYKSTKCSKCGQTVMLDINKGELATCPICGEYINTRDKIMQVVEIACPQCQSKVRFNKTLQKGVCPICQAEIDIQREITKKSLKASGLPMVIAYSGDSSKMIYKHPVEEFTPNTQLIVQEPQACVFIKNGKMCDTLYAGRYTFKDASIKLITNAQQAINGSTNISSKIYFINLNTQMGIKWGTDSKIRLFDPTSGMHIEIGASGKFNIKVSDPEAFLVKLIGVDNLEGKDGTTENDIWDSATIIGKFRALVMNNVKSVLATSIKELGLNILEIDQYLMQLSEKVKNTINESLSVYGLSMTEFYITNILTPDDDPNFQRMKEQYAEAYLQKKDQEIKLDRVKGEKEIRKIASESDAEVLKIHNDAIADAAKKRSEVEAQDMHAKGYSYSDETERIAKEKLIDAVKDGNVVGDVAAVGVALGVAKTVSDATSEIIGTNKTWECPNCGKKGITSRFCPNCGEKKPNKN